MNKGISTPYCRWCFLWYFSEFISTSLSYVSWEGAMFHRMIADVKVLKPFKGTRKGEVVRTKG